ncbi:MAG: hypothetical protein KatS3mg056_2534 [Chloroflexus sp.]|nr:MAG: hypothetical protein KatS3mg056_2534 [Chloroflexus sp.]
MDIDLHSDSHRLARHRMRYQRRLLSQRYGSSSCRIDKIHSRPSLPRPNQASTCTHCPANRERACPGRLCCSRIDRYTQAWTKQDAPQNTLPNGNDRCENHPAPPVPASSGGGVGWGRVGMSCEHIPPAPSPAALGARASGALITCAIRHRRFPPPAGAGEGGGGSVCLASTPPPPSPAALGARASGALPTCAIRRRRFLPPAGAGQGRGGSAYPASTPPTHSPAALGACASGALPTCAIRRRPAALGACASGALPTCAIRRRRFLPPAGAGQGRGGSAYPASTPPTHSPAALGACASGALPTCAIRRRRFLPPAGAGQGRGGSAYPASTPPTHSPAALGACASGALPTCAIRRRRFLPPAGAGQGRGGSAYPASAPLPHPHRQHWERAPPARSSPAPFGAAGSCLQRVQGRVGAGRCVLRARHRLPHRQHCERAPPARSLPANQDLMSSLPGNGATAFRHTRSTDEVGSIPPVPLCPGTGVDVVLWTPRLYDMGDESE